jgi:hypothetical protein
MTVKKPWFDRLNGNATYLNPSAFIMARRVSDDRAAASTAFIASQYKTLWHGSQDTEKRISNWIYNGYLINNSSIEHQIKRYQMYVDKSDLHDCYARLLHQQQ